MIIETDGNDVILTLFGVTKRLMNCNALKLARTLYNKDGDKYSEEEMEKWDLIRR